MNAVDAPTTKDKHYKWIIVTSQSTPTDEVKALTEVPGWKVVVVSTTEEHMDWR